MYIHLTYIPMNTWSLPIASNYKKASWGLYFGKIDISVALGKELVQHGVTFSSAPF